MRVDPREVEREPTATVSGLYAWSGNTAMFQSSLITLPMARYCVPARPRPVSYPSAPPCPARTAARTAQEDQGQDKACDSHAARASCCSKPLSRQGSNLTSPTPKPAQFKLVLLRNPHEEVNGPGPLKPGLVQHVCPLVITGYLPDSWPRAAGCFSALSSVRSQWAAQDG